jgi:hypothetical protein
MMTEMQSIEVCVESTCGAEEEKRVDGDGVLLAIFTNQQ